MTRSDPGTLHSFDPEIDRTFHTLHRTGNSIHRANRITSGIGLELDIAPNLVDSFNPVESAFVSASVSDTESADFTMADNNNRTLKELAAPDVAYQPLCIQYPDLHFDFELKSGLIHLLPKFHGLAGEDPHKHLKEFHVVCSTMKPHGIAEDHIKLRAFPFSLDGAAKDWLYYLQPASIASWNDMKRLFLEKFFPASRAAAIRKDICGIRQMTGETLHEYWERFKKLCASCPHHQISDQLLIQYYYEGLLPMDRSMVDAASGGALVDKTPAAARDLIANMAANAQQFGTRVITSTRGVNEVHVSHADQQRMEHRIDELTSLVRQLAMGQHQTPVVVRVCSICYSSSHPTDLCHTPR